jgi:hypothetical protein
MGGLIMAFIYGVLKEEYDRMLEKKNDYEKKLNELPKGSLVKKQINGRSYDYLMFRENKKVITKYIKKENFDVVQEQLDRRKKIKKSLKSINEDLKILEKVVRK